MGGRAGFGGLGPVQQPTVRWCWYAEWEEKDRQYEAFNGSWMDSGCSPQARSLLAGSGLPWVYM